MNLMYNSLFCLNIAAANDSTKIFPAANSADVGGQATFFCQSDDVKWYYEKRNINPMSTPISLLSNYQIDDVIIKDFGNYFCYGKYPEKSKHFLAKATLRIYGKTCFGIGYVRHKLICTLILSDAF